nr:hypothetical protein [Candidatus Levybacteria bacterium]
GQDGTQKSTTEIVIEDMIILDNRKAEGAEIHEESAAPEVAAPAAPIEKKEAKKDVSEDINPDDIPF